MNPVTDFDFTTLSYQQNGDGYLLTRDTTPWFWDLYLSEPSDASNPYTAPLQAGDLSALPPALVITAEYDPLRDEGEEYGRRLRTAGVPATVSRYDGMIHSFFSMSSILDKGKQAISEASAALRHAFSVGERVASR